jgi:N-acetyl-gamma-glutamyl-phosphate/LysW-gamma-L-alpha-aminoadipyl-6-phosphate reductase
MKVAVVGASGYVGGELLRLLLAHDHFVVAAATSERHAGDAIGNVHPNLRNADLKFSSIECLAPCDLIFCAMSHGAGFKYTDWLYRLAPCIIDLSADFRLREPDAYRRAYGGPHPRPELIGTYSRGLPELNRDELRDAEHIAVPGCMATAAILALTPLCKAGLVEPEIIVDAKMGSSGSGGREVKLGNHHAERDRVMRSFKPVGHRHGEEIMEALAGSRTRVHVSATAVGAVRGVLVTAHTSLRSPGKGMLADVWDAYRECYAHEPFVRLVARRRGLHRLPEPSILNGSNFCDVGFALDDDGRHLVVLSALDNLMKGAAGNALQCANIVAGLPEQSGLAFAGLHPT